MIAKIIRISERTTLDELQIGEVFVESGCWAVYAKISSKEYIFLGDDWRSYWEGSLTPGEIVHTNELVYDWLYKLPKSIQKLWKEE